MSDLPEHLDPGIAREARSRAYILRNMLRIDFRETQQSIFAEIAEEGALPVNPEQLQSILQDLPTEISADQMWQAAARSTALARYTSGSARFLGLSDSWAHPSTRQEDEPPTELPSDIGESEQTVWEFLEAQNRPLLWLRHGHFRINYLPCRQLGMLVILAELLDLEDGRPPDPLRLLQSVVEMVILPALGINDIVVPAK